MTAVIRYIWESVTLHLSAIYQTARFGNLGRCDRWSNNILRNYYLQYPGRLVNNELYLADLKPLENNQIVKRPRKERIKSFLQPEHRWKA